MSTTEEFAAPASATGIKWEDYKGALLLFDVRSHETGIKTPFDANADAIRADVTVLDGPSAGEEYIDTLVFPKVLQSQLRPNVGKKVLGRLGQGAAKPNQSAPWKLDDANDKDRDVARAHLQQNAKPPF